MDQPFKSFEDIKKLPPEEAILILNEYLEKHPESEESYILRGQKHWSLGNRRESINDYLAAIKINPASRARMLLEYANSILSYYNKDLLNP